MRLENLSEMQIDALREVGNIGSGHAATALSQLMGKPIGLTQPQLDIVPFTEVPHVLGGPERLVGAVYARLLGDLEGALLFMAGRDSSLALCDLMHGHAVGTAKSFGREEEALVTHVATILISAYVAAIARLSDISVLPSSPMFALDMAGAILEVVAMEAGPHADSAVLSRASFYDEETSVDIALLHVPAPDSLEVILGRLGVL